MTRKNLITFGIALAVIIIVAGGTALLLQAMAKKDPEMQQTPSKDMLRSDADAAAKQGDTALSNNNPSEAIKAFTDAKKSYQQSGDEQAANHMDAKIDLAKHRAGMKGEQPTKRASSGTGGS